MTKLLDAIARAHAAKRRGGPDRPTGLALAASLPGLEEIADRLLWMAADAAEEMSEADALAAAHKIRGAMLETLERFLTDTEEVGP